MFKIRTDQLASMTAVVQVDFVSRMADHLREVVPDMVTALDHQNLRRQCQLWMNQALDAGLQEEAQVELFLELCACYNEIGAFPVEPWAAAILETAQPPAEKLSALVERTIFAPEAV